jgi:pilus assembly protein CpaC
MLRSRFCSLVGWIIPLLFVGLLVGNASAAEVDRQTLELKVGGSDLVNTAFPFTRVSIANPDVADVVVISPRVLYVYGKNAGYTSVILWEKGKGQTLLDIVISLDLTGLKKQIYELYPNQQIKVNSSETGVVLSGTVSGPEVVEQVLRLTKTFLPKLAEGDESQDGTGRSGTGVTNLLQVSGIHQVMLEVKVVEVNRTKGKDWQAGIGLTNTDNVTGAFNSKSSADGIVDGILQNPGSLLFNFAGNAANIFLNVDDFTAALTLMEEEGLARTLAEPHLVTQSGQEASFLAGGEFPIPVPQGDGDITIEYKEFGVSLVFTPVVLSDGKISLRVAPSVSDIVSVQSIQTGIIGAEFIVPNLSVRKLETTVQLHDGQTLALAGLLQDKFFDRVEKIPGLGDLPIIGALFRSTSFKEEKTELLIAVTPHLVKPVEAGSLRFPGDGMQPPNWYEFYLEGRLEGRRPVPEGSTTETLSAVEAVDGGGFEGAFGYQPVVAR